MKKAAPCSDPEGCAEAAGTLGDMATGPNPRTAPFAGRLRPSRRASASPSRGAAPLSNRVLSAGRCGQSRRPRRHSHSGAAGQAPACGVGRWVLAADSMSSSHYRLSLPMTSSLGGRPSAASRLDPRQPIDSAEDRLARAFLEAIFEAEQANMHSGRLRAKAAEEHNARSDYYKRIKYDARVTFEEPHQDEDGRPLLHGHQLPSAEQIAVEMNRLVSQPLSDELMQGTYGFLSNFVHPTFYALQELFSVSEKDGERTPAPSASMSGSPSLSFRPSTTHSHMWRAITDGHPIASRSSTATSSAYSPAYSSPVPAPGRLTGSRKWVRDDRCRADRPRDRSSGDEAAGQMRAWPAPIESSRPPVDERVPRRGERVRAASGAPAAPSRTQRSSLAAPVA
jgi:hypothetical protein